MSVAQSRKPEPAPKAPNQTGRSGTVEPTDLPHHTYARDSAAKVVSYHTRGWDRAGPCAVLFPPEAEQPADKRLVELGQETMPMPPR